MSDQQLEEALAELERYKKIVDSFPLPLFEIDEEGRMTWLNPAAAKFLSAESNADKTKSLSLLERNTATQY